MKIKLRMMHGLLCSKHKIRVRLKTVSLKLRPAELSLSTEHDNESGQTAAAGGSKRTSQLSRLQLNTTFFKPGCTTHFSSLEI